MLTLRAASTNRLLAKSYDPARHRGAPPDYALLVRHSRDVAEACTALAEVVGQTAFFSADLSPTAFERFVVALKANGWIQDLGKANSHFQSLVTTEPQICQLLRHETISGLLVWLEPRLRDWLSPLADILHLSVWAAMGHHRKFHQHTKPEQGSPLRVMLSHEDFALVLHEMSEHLGLGTPPEFEKDIVIARDRKEACDLPALQSIRALQSEFQDLEAEFQDTSRRRMFALIKGLGIAADVAASAIAARQTGAGNYSVTAFIRQSLKVGLSTEDFSRLIRHWAWSHAAGGDRETDDQSLPPHFEVRPFQAQVAASTSFLTLARAGCGSGKSLAAYLWGRQWCERFASEGRSNFRLFFCLPTTGTATEHFKDYALEAGINAGMKHSRSNVDLQAIAETALQEETEETAKSAAVAAQAALNNQRDKIESLELWGTPLVVTTADTVLGLMSNARRSIYSLPAILSSGIVFDEIHAFDDHLFGHLLVFLKNFPRLPVLLMTASLSEQRLRAIAGVRPDLEVIAGPPEFERLKRYLIDDTMSDEAMWEAVETCLRNDGKVLWVRNRVEWANETYEACRRRFPDVEVNVYHSRFRYKDRSKRHRRVIDSFKRAKKAAILVATQVAEMSLDLSADLLITDIAPIPALIQRLGRLNRRATLTSHEPKWAIIRALPKCESDPILPYTKDEIQQAGNWVAALKQHQRPLSQGDLAEAFAQFSDAREYDLACAEERAVFFSGLWRTQPGQTRGEGHTISVVLADDLARCAARTPTGEPTREWLRLHEVAIPFRQDILKWLPVGPLRVAPGEMIAYDFDETTQEGTGARWRRN